MNKEGGLQRRTATLLYMYLLDLTTTQAWCTRLPMNYNNLNNLFLCITYESNGTLI